MSIAANIAADSVAIASADFSDTFACTRAGAVGTIDGIYTREFSQASQSGMDFETTSPALIAATSDCVGIVKGDTVTVEGAAMYVTGNHPDGTGMTVLILTTDPDQP